MDSSIKQLGCCAVVLVTLIGCASSKQPKVAHRAPVSDITDVLKPQAKVASTSTSSKPWYSPPPAGSKNVAMPASTQTQTVAQSKIPTVAPTFPKGQIAWEWPTPGKTIDNFSSENAQKGIDIAGRNGQPVITAAPGVVVYSGSGLRGYGQMIIVKHNDQFLSAYAHNSRLLVKEGDTVKAHQQIAEMGQTDTESVRLHFEIRKNGQPVDPMDYLPPKGSS